MKTVKALLTAAILANPLTCLADGSVSGTIVSINIYSGDAYQSTPDPTLPPFAIIRMSAAATNTNDVSCNLAGYYFSNLSNEFQKQSYATLVTAKINGSAVTMNYKIENYACAIKSITMGS